MKIEHFYSDIGGTKIPTPTLKVPSQKDIDSLHSSGIHSKIVYEECTMFNFGNGIEVKRTSDMTYRDMYRFINA